VHGRLDVLEGDLLLVYACSLLACVVKHSLPSHHVSATPPPRFSFSLENLHELSAPLCSEHIKTLG
jgi:hypothetical protein